jgi:CYTH domain-containing protein
MAREIERKFTVQRALWSPSTPGVHYRQGYLSDDPERVVRVRVAGDSAFITIKGITHGVERSEFEYPVPRADADRMLDTLCLRPLVEKTRYRVRHGATTWEVDDFAGDNAGLIVAEVELPSADAAYDAPPWLGREVSHDARYFNSNLARHPYARWGSDDGDDR